MATDLADFETCRMQPRYEGGFPDLAQSLHSVHPDREWCREKYGYKFSSIVTTKGCPFRCEFCSVPGFQGRAFRERPVEDVWAEMQETSYAGLMLAEDNFYGYSKRANERARRLFQGMVERGIWKDWFGFSTLATASDEAMLDAMAKSGCFGFLIGLESNNEEVLKRMVKDVNLRLGVDKMAQNIKRIHDYGMIVWGSVIFGADGDDRNSFERMVDYILENSIDVLTFGISTPLPETPMYHRLNGEGPGLPHPLPVRLVLLRHRPRDVPAAEDAARGLHPRHGIRICAPLFARGAPRALQANPGGNREPAHGDVRLPRHAGLADGLRAGDRQPARPLRFGAYPAETIQVQVPDAVEASAVAN